MRRTIYLYIDAITYHGQMPEQVSWVVHAMDTTDALVFRGNLRTAANHALGCRVVVFLSAVDMLLTSAALPAMNKQRLLKAIPYSLEDQLASDVEDLHFAVGERIEESLVACCVIERSLLNVLQESLKGVGIQADVITSEIFGLPHQAESWTVWLNHSANQHSVALVRNGIQSGTVIDAGNSALLLHNNLDAIEEELRPVGLNLYTSEDKSNPVTPSEEETQLLDLVDDENIEAAIDEEGQVDSVVPITANAVDAEQVAVTPAKVELDLEKLNESCVELGLEFESKTCDSPFLAALADNYDESSSINLLQGEFSRKEQFERFLRPWRPAAVIVISWLILQLGLMIGEYIQLSSKDIALQASIINVYKKTFPESKNVVNPKVQMERRLKKLRGGGEPTGGFLIILSKAGAVLKDTPSINIRSVRFKDNKLNLDFEIADLQELDKLKLRLVKEAKLNVDIVSASARDGKVESRLKIQLRSK